MLGADGLNLALMVADSGIIDSAVNDLMARSQVMMMAENRGVKSSVKNHLLKWRGNVKKRITKVCETERFQQELALYQEVIHWDEDDFFERIEDVIKKLEWHSAFYMQARRMMEKNKGVNNPMFPHYFCDQWYQSLADAIKQAQVSELEANKEKVLNDLYQRMETMRNMDKVTESGDAESVGRLWDMASAKLSKTDLTVMKRHAEFLKKHKGLQEIAEQLGRMAGQVNDPDLNRAPAEELQMVEEKSDEATDDIVGIHESDDLNKLLPNETMFLAYPELEVVFYKHLVDKRLMNYRTQGKSRTLRKVKAHRPDNKAVDIEKGPFIVCVDASGSMSGFPEQCAKAMAYALMQIALAEQRDCYVIIFSTEHITYELTKQDGLREAADFLTYSFHGGTDLEPTLIKSIDLMNGDKYKNADMVVISDFIAPKQQDELLAKVDALKAKKNRFHAISLSKYGNPALMSMFDHTWSYHPNVVGRLLKRVSNG
ncbi:TPA: ATPase RavA stimulator ViaA [Vibrio parahaemolyticus]|uniref:ATPase RavA stimulator ViaA n=1 Tax=Vibrio parahaemolyticus TaxID=670 RepID=UPI00063E8BB1|nr:ATPase RavA stimulator ViaA [Vibrio parahaemolyticus]EGQ7919349.1 ATPase RavA stimulator ViaA [Vibrio parahaemolyticus]EGQ9944075.1 ATPase RavA stimulator ViaA [Vibrio parahaemolyticus]EGR1393402.1 ATPase RavA stimulator ViaA [Vibrio parahaemolyticus]EHH3644785.1 ATPase RavA stimulator ViaA [Vibrio parahaemolyticus]EHH3733200.1 ATPase RavA stimulator ViaA [Vibrio parahaemolyticus]